LDDDRLRNPADAKAFADELRIIEQHRNVEAERSHLGRDGVAVVGGVRVEQQERNFLARERRLQRLDLGSRIAIACAPFCCAMITIAGEFL
jgi:hypothetical protein